MSNEPAARQPVEEDVPPWAAGAALRMHELDPELNDEEIAILKRYGRVEEFPAGKLIWRPGDRGPFVLALTGGIDVLKMDAEGEQVIISHGPRHYVGEIITMSGGRALVAGRAREDLEAVVVQAADLRRLIATESDLGEKLLHSFILRRMRMVAERLSDVTLIGQVDSVDGGRLQSFLSRNGIPFRTLQPSRDSAAVNSMLIEYDLTDSDLPVVICNGIPLRSPSNRELAETLGFTAEIETGSTWDVAVIGSGPAGMAAAVYAASEGLSVIVLENTAPGGQAGSSSKIENYMGFPTGISGQALMGRGYLQAQKFGAQIAVTRDVQRLEAGRETHTLYLDGGDEIYARAVVVASGAVYRQPAIEGLDRYGGVHYGASHVEGELCRGRDVAVIGGGNSAGQAAVFLSKHARKVHILIRGRDLSSSMSDYLIQRVESIPNIELHSHTEVEKITGANAIEQLVIRHNDTDTTSQLAVSHLFIFIGARPGTDFVDRQFALDDKGFVLTGDALDDETLEGNDWQLSRAPHLLETSCPRIFAAGDVRAGSVKRVASAVGEGSVCVQFIHSVLNDSTER